MTRLQRGLQAAGILYFVLAVGCWRAYQRSAVMEVVPDGRWHSGPALSGSRRFDYQVVVTGTFGVPEAGITLDGSSAWNRQGETWHHGALEVRPGTFSPQPASGAPHEIVYTPDKGAGRTGEPVSARLSLEQLQSDLYLPRGTRLDQLNGRLQLEVRARDRYLQGGIAAVLVLAGLALLAAPYRKMRPANRQRLLVGS